MTQGGCYGGHSSEGMVRTSGKGSVACRDRWVGTGREGKVMTRPGCVSWFKLKCTQHNKEFCHPT